MRHLPNCNVLQLYSSMERALATVAPACACTVHGVPAGRRAVGAHHRPRCYGKPHGHSPHLEGCGTDVACPSVANEGRPCTRSGQHACTPKMEGPRANDVAVASVGEPCGSRPMRRRPASLHKPHAQSCLCHCLASNQLRFSHLLSRPTYAHTHRRAIK